MGNGSVRCQPRRSVRAIAEAVRATITAAIAAPWFAYTTILLLQLKCIWGIWKYRDLTPGDESVYYNLAYLWFTEGAVALPWSPLYTAFYGTLMYISPHPYVVTTLHRVLVVLALAVLVLAVMRQLLPSEIAWLTTAWWVVLPINYDAAVTLHLFAVIPVLVSWLLVLWRPSPWPRGSALGVLILTTVLVRQEYVLAVIALALVCAWGERRGQRRSLHAYLAGYGVPLLVTLTAITFFFSRSLYPPCVDVTTAARFKHAMNMCQVYAYGFQQRHPEWTRSPWTECSGLMDHAFGKPNPSFTEMIRSNPRAVLVHFLWNLSLVPSGLQLLLFNGISGSTSPDYTQVAHSRMAGWLSLALLSVWVLALSLRYRDRHGSWERWLPITSVWPVALLVILTQRPRPAYLFVDGLGVMALTGLCCVVISRRLPALPNFQPLMPAVALGLILVVPGRYDSVSGARPLLELYEQMAPFRIEPKDAEGPYSMEIRGYIVHNLFDNPLCLSR